MLLPTQTGLGPVTDTTVEGKTVIIAEESDVQPERVFVYTNRAVPLVIPVTRPLLLIVATAGFELIHVPPTDGKNCVWVAGQI